MRNLMLPSTFAQLGWTQPNKLRLHIFSFFFFFSFQQIVSRLNCAHEGLSCARWLTIVDLGMVEPLLDGSINYCSFFFAFCVCELPMSIILFGRRRAKKKTNRTYHYSTTTTTTTTANHTHTHTHKPQTQPKKSTKYNPCTSNECSTAQEWMFQQSVQPAVVSAFCWRNWRRMLVTVHFPPTPS